MLALGAAQEVGEKEMFNYMRNSEGTIVFLAINGAEELKEFKKIFPSLTQEMALETLVFYDLQSRKSNLSNDVSDILQSQRKSLKRVRFLKNRGVKGLTGRNMMKFLKVLADSPIEEFRWERQAVFSSNFKDEDLQRQKTFWDRLKYLSFAGTIIKGGDFFLHKVDFPNLEHLDLRSCGFGKKEVLKLARNSQKMPELQTLLLDNNKLQPQKWKDEELQDLSRFNSLKNFARIGFAHKSTDLKGSTKLINLLPDVIQRSERLSFYVPDAEIKFSLKEVVEEKKSNITDDYFKLYTESNLRAFWGKFRSAGFFFEAQNQSPSLNYPGVVAVSRDDVELLLKNGSESLTLFGPLITASTLDFILKANNKSLRHIFLVHTDISADQIELYRPTFRKMACNLHSITTSYTVQLTNYNHFHHFDHNQFLRPNLDKINKDMQRKYNNLRR